MIGKQTIISNSPEETFRVGYSFADRLLPTDCVAISGELGTGKTRLVQGICARFHCEEEVTSPTFTIINEYRGDRAVYHCDLYRLESRGEMIDAGLFALLDEPGLILVEWAEKAASLLPVPRWEILMRHGREEKEREIISFRCTAADRTLLPAREKRKDIR